MWIHANPNPCRTETEDCVIRAISIATGLPWRTVHRDLCSFSGSVCSMPSVNWVWGLWLSRHGFFRRQLSGLETVSEFCRSHPHGIYVLGTGNHAVAAVDGYYLDAWDSGDEVAICCWEKERRT